MIAQLLSSRSTSIGNSNQMNERSFFMAPTRNPPHPSAWLHRLRTGRAKIARCVGRHIIISCYVMPNLLTSSLPGIQKHIIESFSLVKWGNLYLHCYSGSTRNFDNIPDHTFISMLDVLYIFQKDCH